MLHILGGDSQALREKLLQTAALGGRMIVIVPEQYTLQTERELMDGLSAPGFFDLEVLSPSRLTQRVFALAGTEERVPIDARGKQLAIAWSLIACAKELRYYESAADKVGFVEKLGGMIAQFKRAGVTPEQLRAYAESLDEGASRDKISDLALLYGAYTRKLADQFVDGEDVLESMLARLPDSRIAEDAYVVVYGFDVLTGQMNRILCALSQMSRETLALIVLRREDTFAPVLESAMRLQKEAQERLIPCRFAFLPSAKMQKPPELLHLSEEYLKSPGRAYPGPCGAIRLYAAPNPYYEAHFAAQEMVLLHEKGIPFGDMAVVMGDGAFAGVLSTVLASYNIPAYVSRKLPVASHGAARFLIASLRGAAEGYPAHAMLDLIKSGYAPISREEGWKLENYLISYGIRGKMWLSPFHRGAPEECAGVEEAREKLISPLESLRVSLREAAGAREAMCHVYDYLSACRVFEKLTENEEALLARNMAAECVQTHQVWDAMVQMLSQAYAILGDAKISTRNLAIWLEVGLNACELSSLPPSADAVMCGEFGSLPLSRPRVLFAMNMTDGLLSSGAPGLLTPDEAENAQQEMQVYFSLDEDGKDCLAHLDVWKALSAPGEYLYLTRSQATEEGGALRPFAQLAHIRRLFPGLVEEGGVSRQSHIRLPLAVGPALDALGEKMRSGPLTGEWLEAWKYVSQAPQSRPWALALQRAFQPESNAPALPREVTHALFMERVMSVSRLESFAVCPYKHFVEQGLSPKPRKEWTLTPIDAGNFYHSALEGFTRLLPTLENWPRIDKKTCDAAMDRAAEPLFQQMLSGVMGDSARMKALGDKYRRVLRRVAWAFTRGAKQSAFTPEKAEVKFGYAGGIPPIELTLRDGSRVFVRGIIDRIDRYAGDEGVYLRVVDYKSGADKLDPTRIFWGAQLQLLLYLKAALTMEENAQPAGAFYMRVADPLLSDQEETAMVEDALAKALQLKGVALRDAAILKKMDAGTPPISLPKMLTTDGGFDKRATLADLEQMHALITHAGKMAGELTEKMRSGEIAASPLCDKNGKGPCEYCDFAAICRRDAGKMPQNARKMQEMKFDELLEKVNKNNAGNFGENNV